jgi:NTE family protein
MTETTVKLGLALEGGGAKGAYHMGVAKAYLEAGYTFDAIAGTSIGALNGAVIAQGDFERGYKMWEQLDARSIFDITEEEYRLLMRRRFDTSALRHLASRTRQLIADRGMDTRKMRTLIASIVDENRLRDAAADFGLVTVSLTGRGPRELYKEDIPQGQLSNYLMASASFPGFQTTFIDNEAFIDGGLYDNCPINMLALKGYKQVIAIRTLGLGITQKIRYPDIAVTTISPSEPLGGMMSFYPDVIRRSLDMGYYDALRQLKGYQGKTYCIDVEGLTEEACRQMLHSLPETSVLGIGRMLGLGGLPPRLLWRERIVPRLTHALKLQGEVSSIPLLIGLIEVLAAAKGVGKYAVYTFDDWIRLAASGPLKQTPGLDYRKLELCMVAQRIANAILS